MEIHYRIIGFVLIILASAHLFFPGYFNWKEELKSLSLINRQMMTVHTFFIALGLFLIGLLCLGSSRAMVQTNLGKQLSLGLGIFWGIRLFVQFLGYSSALWKGKPFETAIHIAFSLLWAYFTIIFLTNYFR